MKKLTVTLAAIAVILAGCTTGNAHRTPLRFDQRLSNAEAYDAYVVRRTDELVAGGTPRNKASATAEAEATRRFGMRTNAASAQVANWTSPAPKSHDLSLAELDAAVDDMKKSSGK